MFPLLPPIPAVPAPPPAVEAPARRQSDLGGLRVTYDEHIIQPETGLQIFRGGLTVEYGVTTLTCDELEVDVQTRTGTARGNVRLLDPEGELSASNLRFRWRSAEDPEPAPSDELGYAEDAVIRVGALSVRAGMVRIQAGQWELVQARGTLSRRSRPPVELEARSLTLRPGRESVARGIVLTILGVRLGPWPVYRFDLDPRQEGLRLPSYGRDQEGNLGFQWGLTVLKTESSALTASWAAFPQRATSWNLAYSFSPLDPGVSSVRFQPKSDLAERYSESWLENIQVGSPGADVQDFRRVRRSFGILTDWNATVQGRPNSREVTRALDLSMEQGGPGLSGGWKVTSRLQLIRPDRSSDFVPRGVVQSTWATASEPGHGVSLHLRSDAFAAASADSTFGFLRGLAGASWSPWTEGRDGLRFGVGLSGGVTGGRPQFGFDDLISRSGLHFRSDLNVGPYSLSWLGKYDLNRRAFFDREYEIALLADGFEPFLQYRQNPRSYQLGIRFRLDGVLDRIQSREIRRDR